MNHKSLTGILSLIAVVLGGCIVAVYSFATPVQSNETVRIPQRQDSIAYAQLTIQGEDRVTWDSGGNDIVRVATLDATYRRLGGNQRTSVVNLLNIVGDNGWELVQVNTNVWTFKR